MKLVGRTTEKRGYLVELSEAEFFTLINLNLAMALISSAFDAIYSYTLTLSTVNELKRLTDEAYALLEKARSAEVLVPDLPGETREYTSRLVEPEALGVGEVTRPFTEGRHRWMAVGRDEDGFFVFNHKERSMSYPTPGHIPEKRIDALRDAAPGRETTEQGLGYNPMPVE